MRKLEIDREQILLAVSFLLLLVKAIQPMSGDLYVLLVFFLPTDLQVSETVHAD